MTHVTCRLTAKNRDPLQNPTLGNRVWAAFCVHRRDRLTEKRTDTAPLHTDAHCKKWVVSITDFSLEFSPVVITLREIIFGNLLIVFFLFFLCLFCAARRQLELKRSKSSRKTRAARYIASCARIKVEWTHTRAHTHTRLTALRPGLPRLASTRGTRSSAIAEGPRDASCQLKSCQLPHKRAETTCSTSPEP